MCAPSPTYKMYTVIENDQWSYVKSHTEKKVYSPITNNQKKSRLHINWQVVNVQMQNVPTPSWAMTVGEIQPPPVDQGSIYEKVMFDSSAVCPYPQNE